VDRIYCRRLSLPSVFRNCRTFTAAVFSELFLAQVGRPAGKVDFALGGEVILNAAEARMRKPNGSYGWDDAYGRIGG